jgi:hypothetical protein
LSYKRLQSRVMSIISGSQIFLPAREAPQGSATAWFCPA